MLSIFGVDVRTPVPPPPYSNGPTFCADSIALVRALAEHHDVIFESVVDVIAEILPHSRQSLLSPEGWVLFGQFVASHMVEASTPFRPTVH